MSEILQGLQGFTNYLAAENVRRDQEWEQQKAKISAERIASSFKSLTADHTARDARSLMYDVIADAAALDSLPENMGLIQSLYSDSMQGIENYKKERQDKALLEHMQTYDTELPEGITGQQALQLTEFDIRTRKGYDVFNTEGQKFHTIYDAKGREKQKIVLDPRTQAQMDEEALALYTKQQRIAAGFSRANQPRFQAIGTDAQGNPIAMHVQSGQFYTQGAGGEQVLYDSEKGGGIYRIGKMSESDVGQIQKDINVLQDLATENRKSANRLATGILGSLDYTADQYGFAPAEFLLRLPAEEQANVSEADWKALKTYMETHDQQQGQIQSKARAISLNEMKRDFGIDPQEYAPLYNSVTEVIAPELISKTHKYKDVSAIVDDNSLDEAAKEDLVSAFTARQHIAVRYKGTDKEELMRKQDYTTMWHKLNNQDKGILLKLFKGN